MGHKNISSITMDVNIKHSEQDFKREVFIHIMGNLVMQSAGEGRVDPGAGKMAAYYTKQALKAVDNDDDLAPLFGWSAADNEIPCQLRKCNKFIQGSEFESWLSEQLPTESSVNQNNIKNILIFLITYIDELIDSSTATSSAKFWIEIQDNYDNNDWWETCSISDSQARTTGASLFPAMFERATGKIININF